MVAEEDPQKMGGKLFGAITALGKVSSGLSNSGELMGFYCGARPHWERDGLL